MGTVVERIVFGVMILQCHHKRHECFRWDHKRFEDLSILKHERKNKRVIRRTTPITPERIRFRGITLTLIIT